MSFNHVVLINRKGNWIMPVILLIYFDTNYFEDMKRATFSKVILIRCSYLYGMA
jgi:hypothetical protein